MALTRVSPALFQVSNNITSVTVGGSANTISLTFDSNGVITGASNNALLVSNTAITGNIISSQITSVANTQLTGLIQAAQIGSANATLVTSGTLPTARLPAGTVLQVVNANLTTSASTTSTSAVTTGLTATITPTSATSKILVIVNGMGSHSENQSNQCAFRMVRNIPSANTVVDNQATSPVGGVTAAVVEGTRTRQPVDFSLYDSPATTSAITYTLQFFTTGGGTGYLGRWGTDGNALQSTNLTLMEIAA